jgi:spore germination cell wall hydrolase CwlJ-like protein
MKLKVLMAASAIFFAGATVPIAESIATTKYVSYQDANLIAIDSQGNETFLIDEYPEMKCLAMNIYFEARGSSLADKYAVADVVLNRVLDSRYPDTICTVVHQGEQKPSWKDPNKMVMVRNRCQFSWYCDGKADDPANLDLWMESQSIAWNIFYHDKYRGITEKATHYHAKYVSPKWAKDLQLVGRIGSHIYYRWEK